MDLCPLVQTSVVGTISDFVLQVVVAYRYQNVSDAALDSTFLIPYGAFDQLGVVCDWLVERENNDETLAAIAPLKEATDQFRAATGTLLSRIEGSVREPTFVCAVGNLLPGQEIVVKFSFICPLASAATAGFFGLVIPLNYGAGKGISFDIEISLEVTLSFSDITALESPTHEIQTEISRRRGKVTIRDRNVRQSGDFVLKIGALLNHPLAFVEKSASGELSALVCFQPSSRVMSLTPRTIAIVIDGVALSAAPDGAWQRCSEFLGWFVTGLERAEVSVVFVGSDKIIRLLDVDSVGPVLKLAPHDAASSGEDAESAFERVYENFAHRDRTEILFIGDGEGIEKVPSLLANIESHAAKFRVFVFGMGVCNRLVLQSIADVGQGRTEFDYGLDTTGSIAQKAQYLASSMEQSPMSLQMEWGNLNPILHPIAWWDHAGVFAGDFVYVLANLPSVPEAMTVKLSISCPDLICPLPVLSVEVDPRKYVKCDNIALMTERCLLADQSLASMVDKAEILERSTELAIGVPGHTSFVTCTEDPRLGSYLALLSLRPLTLRGKPMERPLPNTVPYPLRPTPGKRSASVMDITRAKPRATMAASASAATRPRGFFSGSDDDDDDDDDDSSDDKRQIGKSLDSGGQKKTYDMSSLLKFRQASLEKGSAGLDIASMSLSPTVQNKKRGARGGGGKRGGDSSGLSPVRSKSPGKNSGAFSFGGRSSPRQPVERKKTLIVGDNAWRPKKIAADDELLLDLSTMRGILNKVTSKKIGYFINQLLGVGIKTPQHLLGLIELIFERVLSAQSMTPMYADMCHQMSSKCPSFPDPEGGPSEWTFRRLLLNRCQREFEDKTKIVDAAGDLTVGDLIEAEFKMKRRILGNIRFVGELYRLGMLGHSIVVNCVVTLLPPKKLPEVEDLEVLCNLIQTTGAMLEKHNEKSASFMNDLFSKLKALANEKQLEARIRFKLLDLIDLRANGWRAVDTTAKGFRRRPSAPMIVSRAVREVVSVGGQRAGSRAEVQPPRKASPGAAAAVAAVDAAEAETSRQSWGGMDDSKKSPATLTVEPTTSPKQSSHRRHNADTSALESSAKDALEEYFLSYDAEEAIICISELDSPGWLHRVVYIAVSITFTSAPKRKLAVSLLQKMMKEKMLDHALMMRGFEDLMIDMPALIEDCPNAPVGIGQSLGALVASKALTAENVQTIDFEKLTEADASAMVLMAGSLYDALVDAECQALFAGFKLDLSQMLPDASKRQKALSRTVHAKMEF